MLGESRTSPLQPSQRIAVVYKRFLLEEKKDTLRDELHWGRKDLQWRRSVDIRPGVERRSSEDRGKPLNSGITGLIVVEILGGGLCAAVCLIMMMMMMIVMDCDKFLK
jgi:hypothetical protein